jgi:hypothetical protein
LQEWTRRSWKIGLALIKLKKDVSAIFVEKAYTGPGCHDLVTFGTDVLQLPLVKDQSNINSDETNFSCLDTLAKHTATAKNHYNELAKKFRERALEDCVIAQLSPLNKQNQGDFEKHDYYNETNTIDQILSHSFAVLGGKVDTGSHCDTVTHPLKPKPTTVGAAYTDGTREYSDACGVIIPNTKDPEAMKAFFLRPPSERKKVGDKMLHVMNQRKEKKEEIQRAVDRESKKRKLPDQAMPGRKAKKNDEYTKENKIFFTALEHGQPLPLFRGKYAGPNFTRAEMKSIGFQCYHEIKGGTVYIIPRHAWHSVFNSKANCFSYAWDCMYKMFASEQTSNSE